MLGSGPRMPASGSLNSGTRGGSAPGLAGAAGDGITGAARGVDGAAGDKRSANGSNALGRAGAAPEAASGPLCAVTATWSM